MSDCGGMMKPVYVEYDGKAFIVVNKCVDCGFVKKNIASEADDPDLLMKLLAKL